MAGELPSSELRRCSFSFDGTTWVEACDDAAEEGSDLALGPLARAPGWDFYEVAVPTTLAAGATLTVRRPGTPIRLLRIYRLWPSMEPPIVAALRPEGVPVLEQVLPAAANGARVLLVALCPQVVTPPRVDDLVSTNASGKVARSDAMSHRHPALAAAGTLCVADREGAAGTVASIVSPARRAAAAALKAADAVVSKGDEQSIECRRQAFLWNLVPPPAASSVVPRCSSTGGYTGSTTASRHRAAQPADRLLAAAMEVAEEDQAPEEMPKRPPLWLPILHQSTLLPVLRAPSQNTTAGTVPQEGASCGDLSPILAAAEEVAMEEADGKSAQRRPSVLANPSPLQHRRPMSGLLRPCGEKPPDGNGGADKGSSNFEELLVSSLQARVTELETYATEQRLAKEAVEEDCFRMSRDTAALLEERYELCRRVRDAERAVMASDMHGRALESKLANLQQLAALSKEAGVDVAKSPTVAAPSSLDDVVSALVSLEIDPLRNCSAKERMAAKRQLLLKWHPDKNGGSGAGGGLLATRVMQELQDQPEWLESA
eukprot:gnl/TRDRNA2_/TRDRNA2_43373_c0_seq1.p1 gnl/TRDRNA2_/TRDRNA2_43373_c0~~gnl/TRDRNA2_/TRDRNA2_43373_c0_seq1.p1  ORF type:complete len:582 (+),score=112.61 gnl/TRDRNA2_/TRDRNA2_43373_c0_seq1:112-1746(+)